MKIQLTHNHKNYQADLTKPLDISLPIKEGVTTNPSCYWAEGVKFETIVMGSFVGSVKQGGSVNYQKLTITPHGNGTHTECYGHISEDSEATINQLLNQFHFIAELVSVTAKHTADGDAVIPLEQVKDKLKYNETEAVIIRTLPNTDTKKAQQYSGTNPPYLHADVTRYLAERGIKHILIDLPSVDREVDGGKLSAHKEFWKFPSSIRKEATITELIFVSDSIADGLYLLNLQIASLEMDASPSKPVLYKLAEVS
jgi:kynurenine formamidase